MKKINVNAPGHWRIRELAYLYQVSIETFRKWISPFEHKIGPRKGHFYTPTQVKIILEGVGLPPGLE